MLEEPRLLSSRRVDAPVQPGESNNPFLGACAEPEAIRKCLDSGNFELRLVECSRSSQRLQALVVADLVLDSSAEEFQVDQQGDAKAPNDLLPLHTTVLAWHRYRHLSDAAIRFRDVAVEVFGRAAEDDLGS
jgi:hypothetical protein